jgi:hypothetical protein
VNIGITPEGRLITRRASGGIRDGHHPNIATLVRFPDAAQRNQARIFSGIGLKKLSQLGMLIIAIKFDLRHNDILLFHPRNSFRRRTKMEIPETAIKKVNNQIT